MTVKPPGASPLGEREIHSRIEGNQGLQSVHQFIKEEGCPYNAAAKELRKKKWQGPSRHNNMKEKVLAYITQRKKDFAELLVFKHQDMKGAGTRFPVGAVETGASLGEALVRELIGESGIQFSCPIHG